MSRQMFYYDEWCVGRYVVPVRVMLRCIFVEDGNPDRNGGADQRWHSFILGESDGDAVLMGGWAIGRRNS